MIRLLTNNDRQSVLDYLYQEASYNIFMIGDIETFGFDKDFQRVYAEFDDQGKYLSVFLRYRIHAVYYAHTNHFNLEYLDIFKKDSFDHISGKSELIALIFPYLEDFDRKPMHFCKANELKNETTVDTNQVKVVYTKADCIKLYQCLSSIEAFGINKMSEEDFVDGKLTSMDMGITLAIEKNGKIVSTVATTAETTKNAMVVAVATDSEYRRLGYASMLLTELMKLYLYEKHKELCLFYDNPEAGKIYLNLGFKYMGTWDLCARKH